MQRGGEVRRCRNSGVASSSWAWLCSDLTLVAGTACWQTAMYCFLSLHSWLCLPAKNLPVTSKLRQKVLPVFSAVKFPMGRP